MPQQRPRRSTRKRKTLSRSALRSPSDVTTASAFTSRGGLDHGASESEVIEVLRMAMTYTGAGPSVMYATHALEGVSPIRSRGDQ